jgi:hypothetical protein
MGQKEQSQCFLSLKLQFQLTENQPTFASVPPSNPTRGKSSALASQQAVIDESNIQEQSAHPQLTCRL